MRGQVTLLHGLRRPVTAGIIVVILFLILRLGVALLRILPIGILRFGVPRSDVLMVGIFLSGEGSLAVVLARLHVRTGLGNPLDPAGEHRTGRRAKIHPPSAVGRRHASRPDRSTAPSKQRQQVVKHVRRPAPIRYRPDSRLLSSFQRWPG
jgi:Kef-type K+ transport system membrane component KefB